MGFGRGAGRGGVMCQEWTELVTDYLERVLPRRLVRAIDRHLAACPHCSEYLAQMRRTIEITGTIPDEEVPEDVVDAFQKAFEEFHASTHDD
ncbi:MAG: zf-HC2 domain-containing protein [Ilumatobacteraceae bacterium]